jgi:hypothetical protein
MPFMHFHLIGSWLLAEGGRYRHVFSLPSKISAIVARVVFAQWECRCVHPEATREANLAGFYWVMSVPKRGDGEGHDNNSARAHK